MPSAAAVHSGVPAGDIDRSRSVRFVALAAGLLFAFATLCPGQLARGPAAGIDGDGALGNIRIPFVANAGQTDERVAFTARVSGGTAFVTREGTIVYALRADGPSGPIRTVAVEESILGLRESPEGLGTAVTRISSMKGSDSRAWWCDIPAFDAVDLGELESGTLVELRTRAGSVEKVFTVPPGTDPGGIRVRFEGASALEVGEAGELVVTTPLGDIVFSPPVAFQRRAGKVEPVDVAYEILGTSYGFTLGRYDGALPLVIDPLLASTFLGGSGEDGGYCGNALALGTDGSVYVAGYTASDDFPSSTGILYQGGDSDVFVARFDRALTTLLAATYVGGANLEQASAIAVGNDGVYVTGSTMSPLFPTTGGAYDGSYGGSTPGPYDAPGDAFVTKLTSDLSTIVSSTFYGGSACDYARGVFVDGGDVYLTGFTASGGLATSGAFDETHNPGGQWGGIDSYVARFSGDLSTLLAATYLGGSMMDYVEDATMTSAGFYVTGWTASDNYPWTPTAYDTTFAGGVYDAFVTGLDRSLGTLLGSTYLGGTEWDFGYGMTSDAVGNVYVTGHFAESGAETTFPTTPGAFQTEYNGTGGPNVGDDAFVSKFDPALETLVASTILGGTGWEYGNGLDWHPSGHVYATGTTSSEDFPCHAGAHQEEYGGNETTVHFGDGFVTKLSDDLTAVPAATYLGGSSDDFPESIAADPDGNVYVSGTTWSEEFVVTYGAYDEDHAGGGENDVFVSVLSPDLGTLSFTAEPSTGVAPFDVTLTGVSSAVPPPTVWQWDFGADGSIDATGQVVVWTCAVPGLQTVRLVTPDGDFDPSVTVADCIQAFDTSSALRFDGDETQVVCAAAPDLNLTSELTLEAWIRPDSWGGFPIGTWGLGQVVGKENFKLFLVGVHPMNGENTLCLRLEHEDGTSSVTCAPDSALVLGEWQHVAAAYDAATSTARLWINGAEQAVTHPTAPSGPVADHAAVDLRIGNSEVLSWSFEGDIDEVRVWGRALETSEIEAGLDSPLSGDEPGLTAYWRMDEGNGGVILDRTNSGHAGTLEGPSWVQGVVLIETSVPEDPGAAEVAGLSRLGSYPNPFNPRTTIAFELPSAGTAVIAVYDASGRRIRTLIDGRLDAGRHTVLWDGTDDRGRNLLLQARVDRLDKHPETRACQVIRVGRRRRDVDSRTRMGSSSPSRRQLLLLTSLRRVVCSGLNAGAGGQGGLRAALRGKQQGPQSRSRTGSQEGSDGWLRREVEGRRTLEEARNAPQRQGHRRARRSGRGRAQDGSEACRGQQAEDDRGPGHLEVERSE
jgi:PKD repeat protein